MVKPVHQGLFLECLGGFGTGMGKAMRDEITRPLETGVTIRIGWQKEIET